ncbi:pentapeptide repeat-containing protein [Trichormus variabilis]|uniref:DUF559 domain-containing protein n=1 Tax=Trichormus variabilis SAG 1403-4b TaxID=447716 RepID=A0A3S1AE09_ANAVA|nr:pentapeptide repeat-containing protein [Trichormus variabilis]MBD2625446.1 pentapeptide repeat-containing protein [Trichormus variabilis FACHB-164]RUS98731.1 hypothetical protein DSM107003_07500 [Trichormus variabilis SAG 1403-4b]
MANSEHLAILKRGVEVWNQWRDKNQNIRFNLEYRYFDVDDLSKANSMKANLSNADLSNADLSNADLRDADLRFANLSNADLRFADLRFADLRFANLSNAKLSDAKLEAADLSGANLRGANLRYVYLDGAKLRGANLELVDISRGFMFNYDIRFTCDKANFTGVCIEENSWPRFTPINEVICEYVYIINDDETKKRIPENRNFEPGEFAGLWQRKKSISRNISQSDNTINNQGVQFFDQNIHHWQRLKFKSQTEIKIAQALERAGVLFFPNCLARLNTVSGRGNKEPDFLICYNGQWGILEVDGPHHDTPEQRFKDEETDQIFKKNGIKVVERFDADRCYDNPDEVVQEFFKMIDIGYS